MLAVDRDSDDFLYRQVIDLINDNIEAGTLRPGDRLRVDAAAGRIDVLTTARILTCEAIPDFLVEMLRDGGLVPHLEKKLKARRGSAMS